MPIGSIGCGTPIGNNSGPCREVAQVQLAMNKKHLPGRGTQVYACNGTSQKLTVDGKMGPETLKAVGRFYGEVCCKSTGFLWETCNCLDCSLSKSTIANITSGVDVSDESLCNAGFVPACGTSNFSGSTNYFNTTKPLNNNGYIQFNGYSNFNLPGYASKQPSVMGNFYPGQYDFVNDNPQKSNLEHSYGKGKGFGFNGYSNQVGQVRASSSQPRPNMGSGQSRFQNRISNMGCNGLLSRRDALSNKLDRFQTQGIRPAQQRQLNRKIDFINNELVADGCSMNFSGNGFSNI